SSKYNTATCRASSTPSAPAGACERPPPDQSDRVTSAVTARTTTPNAATTAGGIPSQRRGAGVARVTRRIGPVAGDGLCNASANSAVVGKRSAGVLASARRIASSTASGIVTRTIDGGDTMSSEWRASTACAVGPVNGGSPTNISYTTHAKLY